MAPVSSVAAVSGTQQPGDAAPAKGPLPAKEPVDPSIRVCLDFLKGRCNRMRCKFLHPDLFQYQQLSVAVHAQAGRQICEVWAMTGQCKFGAKCNKLHPVLVPQPIRPVVTIPMPVVFVPQYVPATPPLPQRKKFPTPSQPARHPPRQHPPLIGDLAPIPAAPTPLDPHHVSPVSAPQLPGPSAAEAEVAEAEFQSVAQSVLKALESGRWGPCADLPAPSGRIQQLELPQESLGLNQAMLDLLDEFKLMSTC
eukprot:GGOE01028617.1.p1 GENE.GGOE01028617.1~~GGOE01028617.1.p1  ORF type:complete len:261 (-),score=66.31 GGOE01028617.1:1486-2241(-)